MFGIREILYFKAMNLKAIVVDDEVLARENLKMLLSDFCKGIEVVGEADGVESALKVVQEQTPHVIFLDIRMPSGAEGFDLLKQLDCNNIIVVFVTAFKDYAIRAFNANAIHYILKPIDIDDLRTAVEKIRERWQQRSSNINKVDYNELLDNLHRTVERQQIDRIAIHHAKGIKIIHTRDIVRIEASGNCAMLHFTNGEHYLDTRTLKIYDDMLINNGFFRTHKSHLINLDYLQEYLHSEGHYVVLSSGDNVPVSRARVSHFLTKLKEL